VLLTLKASDVVGPELRLLRANFLQSRGLTLTNFRSSKSLMVSFTELGGARGVGPSVLQNGTDLLTELRSIPGIPLFRVRSEPATASNVEPELGVACLEVSYPLLLR
jgi:hypothetical protein